MSFYFAARLVGLKNASMAWISKDLKTRTFVNSDFNISNVTFILNVSFEGCYNDPFLKARLGSQNLERLKKAIVAQPKMYDGKRLQSTKLIIDSPDSEETLEDAEEIENVNQKTYAYADVRAKNQDLLMTISELKAKLIAQAKNMNTKFDKSATLEKLDCVTPLNKNKDLKATTVSKDVKKLQSSITSIANKNDTMNSNVSDLKTNVLKAKTVNVVHDGSNLVCVSCGKDVFMISHDKCVARYALSSNSRVKGALFTSSLVAKSSKLEDTPAVVASDDLRDALSMIFGLSELKLLEQALRSPEYVPNPMELEDHVPVYILEPEHPEDLVPAEDEAPTPPLPPFFLSPRIRPPRTRAAMDQMRATTPSTYHSLLPSGTLPLLPIPLPAPSTSRRADIPEADTPPRKRLLLTTPRPSCEVGESSAAAVARQPRPTMAHRVNYSLVDTMETRFRDTERRMMTALEMVNMRVSYQVDVHSRESSEFYSRHHDAQKDRAAVRAEIKVLRRKALEARVTVLETEVRRHEWQRQAADDLAVQHIMRTQALEAGARVDTLEDTGSNS
ncbi:hypothetical protein Tco_0040530 [Tanacetum coccineum]